MSFPHTITADTKTKAVSHPSTCLNLVWTYGLFWYLTGITQLLIGLSRTGSFEGFKDATITALVWLIPILLAPHQARKTAGILGILIWLLALPGFGYFLVYRQEMTQSLIFIIFESNKTESTEYFQNYMSWGIAFGFIAFSVVPIYLWSKIKNFSYQPSSAIGLITVIIFLVFASPTMSAFNGRDVKLATKSMDKHFSVAPPWQLGLGYWHYRQELGEIERQLLDFKKIPALTYLSEQEKPLPTTIVLVIGESTNRLHMGLYGYHRNTNPKLSSMRDELSVFKQGFRSVLITTLQFLQYCKSKNRLTC